MSNKTIAVVDDDPVQLELIAGILDNYTVQCFSTAKAFFSAYQEGEKPSILLCDVQMEGLDGYGVCRQVRVHPILSSIPVILISGLADQADFIEAVEVGANEYISKPFHAIKLKELVEKELTLSESR